MSVIPSSPASPSPPDVIVIGAGVAGLTLAIALHRRGLRPVVLERKSEAELRGEGAFLTLAPNGVNALRVIDLAGAVSAAGMATTGLGIHNERGRQVAFIDYGTHRARFGAPSVTVGRGALVSALLDRAQAEGIAIRFGRVADAVDQDKSGVTVTSGGETFRGDCLIGADGLRSRLRRAVAPDAPEPSYTGLVGTGGFVDAPDVPATAGVMQMVFGRRAFFGYIKEVDGPVYWFNSYPASAEEASPVTDPVAYARFIAGLHSDDPPDVPRIVRHIDRLERSYPIFDVPELPRWSQGRIGIIGDAAHAVAPHSGQGASMAIEDAVLLAASLRDSTDIAATLKAFEAMRRPRTRRAIEIGRMSGSQKHAQSWLALRIRDLILPAVMPMAVRAQEELYAFRADLFLGSRNAA